MATVELRLNSRKPGNYAFFCPVTKLHLTLANPVGITDGVSPYILRGVKSKTLIDVNGVIDLEAGKANAKVGRPPKAEEPKKVEQPKVEAPKVEPKKVEAPKAEEVVKSEEAIAEQKVEEKPSQEAEAVADDKKNKKGKKPQNADAE